MKTLLKRSISTILLLGLIAIAYTIPSAGFYVLLGLAMYFTFFTVFEFTSILKRIGHPVNVEFTSLCVTAMVAVLMYKAAFPALLIAFFFVMHSWMLFLTSQNKEESMRQIFNSLAAFFLFAIPFSTMVMVYKTNIFGTNLLLFLILVTKAGDIGAYAVGSLCGALLPGGNHKMIPSISPGKSWEGALGGLIFCVGVSCLLWNWSFSGTIFIDGVAHPVYLDEKLRASFGVDGIQLYQYLVPALLGIVFYICGAAGDLAESSFKRICAVKDSGRTLPGIGGILDLTDSLLINSVVFWIFLQYLRPQWC